MKLQLHYRPFEDTRWELFGHSDIELHTLAVLSYINFCTDTVAVKKNIKMCPNQKSWFNNHRNMWQGIRITTVLCPPLIPPSQTNLTHSLRSPLWGQLKGPPCTPTLQRNGHSPFISIRSSTFCRTTSGRQLDLMVFEARYRKHVPTSFLQSSQTSSITHYSRPQFLLAWKLQPSSVCKISAVTTLNDYRPIALTAVIVKCFERLVLTNIKTCISPRLD